MFIQIFIIAIFSMIITVVLIKIGSTMFKTQFKNIVIKLFFLARNDPPQRYFAEECDDLPSPVQKYFKVVLNEGQNYINCTRLKHGGYFRLKSNQKWIKISGEEYFTAKKIGFAWYAKICFFSVMDSYIEKRGRLTARLLSLITVVDSDGDKIDQGELLRWLGEAPLFPTALLPSHKLKWNSIDKYSSMVILSEGRNTVEGVFYFNEQGKITHFTTERYKGNSLEKWTGYYNNYRKVDGMLVPHSIEAVWNLKSGDFSYAKFDIDKIEYNKPLIF